MALLRLGKSQQELRELYLQKAGSLSEPELVALFGRRPSRFMEMDDVERGTLTYNELKSLLFVDDSGRKYQPYGSAEPRWCYVLLPKSETLRERKMPRDAFDITKAIDFPRVGDALVLRVIGARDHANAPVIHATVVSVMMKRQATGLLEMSVDLPTATQIPDSRVGRRREADVVRNERRRLGLEGPGDQQHREEKLREKGYFLDGRRPDEPPSKRRLVQRPPKIPSAYKKW